MQDSPPDPPSRTTPEDEARLLEDAALWLARLDSETVDLEAFQAWRDGDPRRALAFARVAGAWTVLGESAESAPVRPVRWEMPRRRAAMLILGLAATGGAGAFSATRAMARHVVETRVGQVQTVRPTPGTALELNTDTRLAWRKWGDDLSIWLERGEVAVQVSGQASGRERAVRLYAGPVKASLFGGDFNIRLKGADIELTVIQGRAEIDRAQGVQSISLVEGRTLKALGGEMRAFRTSDVALDRAAAWPQGEIVFRNEPLADAVAEYNRYLDRKVVILDPEIGQLRIGGRFTSNDPEVFLAAVQASLPVRAHKTARSVVLTGTTD